MRSLVSLATVTASSVSVIDWIPGEVSDTIVRSMPVASMILIRSSTSSRCDST